MASGAAVIGVMRSVAKLGLPVHVIGVICSAENMPGGSAQRPGDIVKIYNGKTVEVLNTDAEGRMVLADGLAWVSKEHKPDAIIDMATLTGAVQVALGNVYIGGMTNDQALLNRLLAAGRRTWERIWQLPLGEEYTEMMKGDLADLKNISGGRGAGTIVGAAFLENFVNERPWVHLDIASTAWQDDASKPYQPKGATAVGVRLLMEFLRANTA
jgi:leucyl aminopeptidase